MIRGLTFEAWHAQTPDLPGFARAEFFGYLPADEQAQCWANLEQQIAYEREVDWRFYEEDWPPPNVHQPARRAQAATPTRPGSVALSNGDDPLKRIAPRVYVEALTGEAVPANGWLCCPLPDHDEETPSFQVLSSHWRCFGCSRGGSSIDLGAAIYGITPRGPGWWEIRDRLVAELEGVLDV